jgi:hypothetical protein
MNTILKSALLAFSLSGLVACSSTPRASFRVEAAPDAPISSYRTYSWAFDGAPAGASNALLYDRVRDAMDRSLVNAGYSKAADGRGDMILAYTIGARDRVDVTDWGPVGPYYPGYGRASRYGWSYNYREIDVRTVKEGSLAVDVFDARTDRPVWHGIATASIGSKGASDELVQSAADGLVERLVKASSK